MKTLISRSQSVLIPVMFPMLLGWLTPANSFAQPAKGRSKFYLGADISSLASGRGGRGGGRGLVVYQENGQEGSEFAIMMKHGWNAFRLRVFVSPVRAAPNNSLENTIPLARQIKDAGRNVPAGYPLFRYVGRSPASGNTGRLARTLTLPDSKSRSKNTARTSSPNSKTPAPCQTWFRSATKSPAGCSGPSDMSRCRLPP